MSAGYLDTEHLDLTGVTNSTLTTNFPTIAAAAVTARNAGNSAIVEEFLRHLQSATDAARRMHL